MKKQESKMVTTQQNKDFPNIPDATQKIVDKTETKETIKKTSELAETGKTDNIETKK